eukprot:1159735-Pelagomonas_calceolata.AAC.11
MPELFTAVLMHVPAVWRRGFWGWGSTCSRESCAGNVDGFLTGACLKGITDVTAPTGTGSAYCHERQGDLLIDSWGAVMTGKLHQCISWKRAFPGDLYARTH